MSFLTFVFVLTPFLAAGRIGGPFLVLSTFATATVLATFLGPRLFLSGITSTSPATNVSGRAPSPPTILVTADAKLSSPAASVFLPFAVVLSRARPLADTAPRTPPLPPLVSDPVSETGAPRGMITCVPVSSVISLPTSTSANVLSASGSTPTSFVLANIFLCFASKSLTDSPSLRVIASNNSTLVTGCFVSRFGSTEPSGVSANKRLILAFAFFDVFGFFAKVVNC